MSACRSGSRSLIAMPPVVWRETSVTVPVRIPAALTSSRTLDVRSTNSNGACESNVSVRATCFIGPMLLEPERLLILVLREPVAAGLHEAVEVVLVGALGGRDVGAAASRKQ